MYVIRESLYIIAWNLQANPETVERYYTRRKINYTIPGKKKSAEVGMCNNEIVENQDDP